jgi:hypothetical protein
MIYIYIYIITILLLYSWIKFNKNLPNFLSVCLRTQAAALLYGSYIVNDARLQAGVKLMGNAEQYS